MAADVDAMTAMASLRRSQYARYQPVFWHPAADAEQVQRPYLARLIQDQDVITLVSEESGAVTGFLIAQLAGAPPSTIPVARPAISMTSSSGQAGGPPRECSS